MGNNQDFKRDCVCTVQGILQELSRELGKRQTEGKRTAQAL